MTQFSTPTPRRSGGDLDVYTGLLCAAFLVLLAGGVLLAGQNIKHSKSPYLGRSSEGGVLMLVERK